MNHTSIHQRLFFQQLDLALAEQPLKNFSLAIFPIESLGDRQMKLWDNSTKHRDRLLVTILAEIYDSGTMNRTELKESLDRALADKTKI